MKATLPFVAVALAALAGSSVADTPPASRELAAAIKEQRIAEAEADRLRKAAETAKGKAGQFAVEQAAAAADLQAAEARISAATMDARLRRDEAAASARKLADRQAPLSSLVAGLVSMGRRPPVLAIADSGSLEEMVRVRMLLDATTPAIRQRTAGLKGAVDRTRALQQAADASLKRLAEARGQLADKRNRLAALEASAIRDSQRFGVAAVGAEDRVIAADERTATLGNEAARNAAARRMAAELATLGGSMPRPFAAQSQASRPPLAYRLPIDAPVVDGTGAVGDTGIASRGMLFRAARGAPVVMPAPGTIVFSGPHGRHDGVVIIDHGGGWMTLMTGVASDLSRGSRPDAGSPIGRALGPVTVELSMNGRPVSAAIVAIRSPVTGR